MMSSPTPGYEEASKRAAEAAKQEQERRQAEEQARQEIINRQRTQAVSSRDQPQPKRAPGVRSTSDDLTTRDLREVRARGEQAAELERRRQQFNAIEQRRQLQEEGKVQRGDIVTSRFDPTTGISTIRARGPREAPQSAEQLRAVAREQQLAMRQSSGDIERSFIKGLAAEARGRQFGFVISDRELKGEIFPDTRRRAADVAVGIGAEDPRFEGVAKFAGDDLQITRQYQVFLEDSISGRPPPGRRHFEVNLTDRISGGPYEFFRSPGENVLREQRIGLAEDPAEAFKAPFENIVTQFIAPGLKGVGLGIGALFGGKPSTISKRIGEIGIESGKQYKPDIETAFGESFIIPTISDVFSAKPAPTGTVERRLADFAALTSKEKPASVAASAAASAILFLPELPFKGARLAKNIPSIITSIGRTRRATKEASVFIDFTRSKELQRIGREFEAVEKFTTKTQPRIFGFDVKLAKVEKVRAEDIIPGGAIEPRTGRRNIFRQQEPGAQGIIPEGVRERPVTVNELLGTTAPTARRRTNIEVTENLLTEPLRFDPIGVYGSRLARRKAPFEPTGTAPLTQTRELAQINKELQESLRKIAPDLSETRTIRTQTRPIPTIEERRAGIEFTIQRENPFARTAKRMRGIEAPEDITERQINDLLSRFAEFAEADRVAFNARRLSAVSLPTLTGRSAEGAVSFGDPLGGFGAFSERIRFGKARDPFRDIRRIGRPKTRAEEAGTQAAGDISLSIFGALPRQGRQRPSTLKEYLKAVDDFNKDAELSISPESTSTARAKRRIAEQSGRIVDQLTPEDLGIRLAEARAKRGARPRSVTTTQDIIKRIEKAAREGERQTGKGLVQITKQKPSTKPTQSQKEVEKSISKLEKEIFGTTRKRRGVISPGFEGEIVRYPPVKDFDVFAGFRAQERPDARGGTTEIIKRLTGIDSRTSNPLKVGQSSKAGERQIFKQLGLPAEVFKFASLSGGRQAFRSSQGRKSVTAQLGLEIFRLSEFTRPFEAARSRQRLTFDIPGFGKQKKRRRGRKGGFVAEFRTFRASSLPLAFLGRDSPLARKFETVFGDYY